MNIIEETIIKNRPNISKSSLKTYESLLRNLHNKVFDNDNLNNYIERFNESDKIIKYLKDLEPRKRKTLLSALVVITDKKEYRDLMLEDIKNYNNEENKQVKSSKQKENWVEKDMIIKLYKDLSNISNSLYKKQNLTSKELQYIQKYIILSLLGGMYIPPRRSKDFVDFKIKNIDKDKDNYIDKNKLVFNSYKTAKTYGKQEVEIPKTLKAIITKWIKVNPTEYLFFDTNNNKISNVKLNQRLNLLFGKKASVNILRHSYLSDKYGDMIDKQNDLDLDMSKMGSSKIQEKIYIKK